jgi:hypothetical protein
MGGMGGMEGMMGGGGGGGMGGQQQGPPPEMGEEDGGVEGGTQWKWEMKDDEIIVRITMDKPATKKDLKVTFSATKLKAGAYTRPLLSST